MAKVSEYNRKRNFNITSEPADEGVKKKRNTSALRFVVQKHDARHLHYDFRLELDGTLKSWAVPKGPSLDPKEKRLAVHVEDHPLSYRNFEGSIPHGQYGAGDVIVWDQGVWQPLENPAKAYKAGKLKFTLVGEKLTGDWALVRTKLRASGDKEQWLLIKERDQAARNADDYDVVNEQPQSVITGTLVGGAQKRKKEVAKKAGAAFPEQLSPELATLVNEPPAGDWLYEIKFDGYRILTRIRNGEVRLFTRNGHDWTDKLPLQAEAIAALNLEDTWLDGEVVVLNEQGLPDFQALQRAFEIGRSHNIFYYLFDAPYLNGVDLRSVPVEERRLALQKIVPGARKSLLRFSEAFDAHHRDIIASACAMLLEGVIGKRAGSPYVSRRSADWIKLKCRLRQEFVIIGFTKPQGSRNGFGALLLGVYSAPGGDELLYAGRVGTGFNEAFLKQLHKQLRELERETTPLTKSLTGLQARDLHWVQPQLVCEVEFAEWTGEGILRQAAFIALRGDKPASEIIREQPRSANTLKPSEITVTESKGSASKGIASKGASGTKKAKSKNNLDSSIGNKIASVTITNPDRVIDSQSGAQKIGLAQFYADIFEWILTHLQKRPVSLLRAPEGVAGEQFFQKHSENLAIPNIKQLDPKLDPGHARLMEIDSAKALVGAVQMGTIELHTWGATYDRIEKPDRIILDLDPDPALPWRSMIEATRLTLAVLDELELDAFLKTSGGKGIHIIIPLARHADWDTVKSFAKAISAFMARQIPERFVAKMGPKNRVGKIFIDYLRNSRGASTVAAYSVRARPGLAVSVPITRDELQDLNSAAQWHIGNLHERLARQKADPWEGYANRQRISASMWKRLGVKLR